MPTRYGRPYPPEYLAEAVRLVREDGRDLKDEAESLGDSQESLRIWLSVALPATEGSQICGHRPRHVSVQRLNERHHCGDALGWHRYRSRYGLPQK